MEKKTIKKSQILRPLWRYSEDIRKKERETERIRDQGVIESRENECLREEEVLSSVKSLDQCLAHRKYLINSGWMELLETQL